MKMAKLFQIPVEEILVQVPVTASRSGIRIPVIGASAAGIPICAIEEHIDDDDPDTWEEISERLAATGTFVAIRIKGDSMAPNIQEKDILIVRVQDDVDNGDIAIVMVNGDEVTCKKIKKTPEGVMLIPFNPEYDTMFYTNAEIESLPVRIYGKVIETRRKY
jgi:repressor LexA